jgi:hypothetical protein
VARGQYEEAIVDVRFALRKGFVLPVFALSAVTTGIFVAGLGLHYWKHAQPVAEPSAAIIVAIPAFVATWVAPGRHRLVQRMFKGLRLLVFISAFLSFMAAATLAVSLPEGWRPFVWWALGSASASATIVALAALVHSWVRSKVDPGLALGRIAASAAFASAGALGLLKIFPQVPNIPTWVPLVLSGAGLIFWVATSLAAWARRREARQ